MHLKFHIPRNTSNLHKLQQPNQISQKYSKKIPQNNYPLQNNYQNFKITLLSEYALKSNNCNSNKKIKDN